MRLWRLGGPKTEKPIGVKKKGKRMTSKKEWIPNLNNSWGMRGHKISIPTDEELELSFRDKKTAPPYVTIFTGDYNERIAAKARKVRAEKKKQKPD